MKKSSYYKGGATLTERIVHATRGIYAAWQKEPNFRIEILFGLAVFAAMAILPLTNTDRAILVLMVVFVLALESINSIFERVLDLVRPEFSEEVKKIKDTMAGVVFIGSLASIIVGLLILVRPLVQFDVLFADAVAVFQKGIWLTIANAVTVLGGLHVIAGLASVLFIVLLFQKKYELAGFIFGATVLGEVFLVALKFLFERPRPIEEGFNMLVSYSFPSGHVFIATVVYLSVGWIMTRAEHASAAWWLVPGIVIPLVALSRVILSVHWVSDVVGGFILGIFWLFLWYGINKRIKNNLRSRKRFS